MSTATNPKLERLTNTIQSMLDGNPALMIGSGCSVAYGLPSMNSLAAELKARLNPVHASNTVWESFTNELEVTKNLESALGKIDLGEDLHSDVVNTIWAFIDMKEREAISAFLASGSAPALTKILKKFVQQTNTSNIITTNYDRLVEFAVDHANGLVETGFTGNIVRDFTGFQKNSKKRGVNLYKVHGSIDWFKHSESFRVVGTSYYEPTVHSAIFTPMIVTPGFRKYQETHNDPFRTVMSEADRALRSSNSYLCIGYGFNDEHIQPIIIDENRTRNKPIVVVTKDVTEKIREKFLGKTKCNCLIISEHAAGGTQVHYSATDAEYFDESFWDVDGFYKLWME